MSTTATFHTPAPVRVPRAAPAAAWLAEQLILALRALARRATAPAVPDTERQRRRVSEAAALRRYAKQQLSADPRFATDLCAAADRHEREE